MHRRRAHLLGFVLPLKGRDLLPPFLGLLLQRLLHSLHS